MLKNRTEGFSWDVDLRPYFWNSIWLTSHIFVTNSRLQLKLFCYWDLIIRYNLLYTIRLKNLGTETGEFLGYSSYSPNSLLIILPKLAANGAEQNLTAVNAVNTKKKSVLQRRDPRKLTKLNTFLADSVELSPQFIM